ncbi:MAG TPA: hypothetical protein VGI60_08915 [Chthoniobacterales bacterium]
MNGKISWRADLLGAAGVGGIVLLFCACLLWHNPQLFWNDDYEISILPVFADVARSWSKGQWPLLSPCSWVCGNLAGEFQYGTFSLFVNALIVLIWKFPLAFAQQAAALSMAHLFVLGAGGFLLARGRTLSPPLATIVGLVAALNGWIMSWGATDWFGSLGAFAWLPWAWWAMERATETTRSKWRFLWPPPFVYLVVTGGFPYTVGMMLLVAVWLAIKSLGETQRLSSIVPLSLGVALGFGLAAPAWLALISYVHGSARTTQLDPGSHWQWIVPPTALPGLIYPGWTVNWLDFANRLAPHAAIELACGTVPPLALLAALAFRFRSFVRHMKWELGLLALVLLLSMLPTAGFFRWSFRWLPLLHLVLVLLAAKALASFRLPPVVNWLLGLSVFASLLITYLSLPTNVGVPRYPFSASLTNPHPLDPTRLYLSIYPPPESAYRLENHPAPVGQITRPGSSSMWAGLRFVNGYSPVRAAGVGKAFAFCTHGEIEPSMADYLVGRQAGKSGLLATIGVDGIIIAKESTAPPPPPEEWTLVYSGAEGRVYHRRGGAYPELRALKSLDTLPNQGLGNATISLCESSRLSLSADVDVPEDEHTAVLALARPFFDGYLAKIGNERLAVTSYRGLIPTVSLPPGTHGRLTISYRPWWLLSGTTVAAISALIYFLCLSSCRLSLTKAKRLA